MVPKHLVFLLAGSLAASTLASAQEKETGTAGARPAKTQEAATRHRELTLPVAGLTEDNLQAAQEAVAAIRITKYACEECAVVRDKAGKCPDCGEPLAAEQVPAVMEARMTVDAESLALRMVEGGQLGLAQIDAALRPEKVHVDREALEIRGPARIVFSNVTSKEGVAALEKALKEAKLVPNAKALFREEAKEAQVQVEGTGAPVGLAALTALARTSGATWTVSDVVWTSTPKPKG